MPPKGIDFTSSVGENYALHDRKPYPSAAELKDIYRWIEQGAPLSEEQEDPFASLWMEYKGKGKRPRLGDKGRLAQKVEMRMRKPHHVPASGVTLWQGEQLLGPTEEDLYVTGFHLKSNLNVVHHTNIFYLPKSLDTWPTKKTDFAQIPLNTMGDGRELIMSTFSRRDGYDLLPPKRHYLIPKGSYVVMLFHYNPSGRKEINQATLTLFHDPDALKKGSREVVRLFHPRDSDFVIPAHSRDIKFERTLDVAEDAELIRVGTHGHFRLKATRVYVIDPDGLKKTILNVPFYQFKFQPGFQLTKPISVKKGSRIVGEFTYDNSELNPANPDPSKTVKLGTSTYDSEMAVFRVHYIKAERSDK